MIPWERGGRPKKETKETKHSWIAVASEPPNVVFLFFYLTVWTAERVAVARMAETKEASGQEHRAEAAGADTSVRGNGG